MTTGEQSEIGSLFKAAFSEHEKVERGLLAAHERLDNERFAAFDERLDKRMKWLKWLTLTNALAILAILGSLAAFLITEHDNVTTLRESVVSVRLAIDRLHVDQIADRARDRADAQADRDQASANAQADRNQASANRQRDRQRSMENNAADRAKAASENKAARANDQVDRDYDKANRERKR